MTDRTQNWLALWYPEDPTHEKAMQTLKEGGYQYAAILHDKDTWTPADEEEDPEHKAGSLKKPHWHVVICFPWQKTIGPVSKLFGIPANYFEPADTKKLALRYLLHLDDPDKYQYDPAEAFGPLACQIPLDSGTEDESTQVLRLLDLLETLPSPLCYRGLLIAACNAGLYPTLRRMGVGALKLLDEHNRKWEYEDLDEKPHVSYETHLRDATFRGAIAGYNHAMKEKYQ